MEIWLSILKTFVRKSSFNNSIAFAAQSLLQEYALNIFQFLSNIGDVVSVATEEDHVKNELVSTTLKVLHQNTIPQSLLNHEFVVFLVHTVETTFSQTNKLLALQCIIKVLDTIPGGLQDASTWDILKNACLRFTFIPDSDQPDGLLAC